MNKTIKIKKSRVTTIRLPQWADYEIKLIQDKYPEYNWNQTDIILMGIANMKKWLAEEIEEEEKAE